MFLLFIKHEIKNGASLGSFNLDSQLRSVFSETCRVVIDCGPESVYSSRALVPEPLPATPLFLVFYTRPSTTSTWLQPGFSLTLEPQTGSGSGPVCLLCPTPCPTPLLLPPPEYPSTTHCQMRPWVSVPFSSQPPCLQFLQPPYRSLKSRSLGKEQLLSRSQLLSQSCSLPPTASPLLQIQ